MGTKIEQTRAKSPNEAAPPTVMIHGTMKLRRWIFPVGFAPLIFMSVVSRQVRTGMPFRVRTGAVGPQTEVQVARPTFRWEIWARDGSATVSEVRLLVDGEAAPATYDERAKAVTYTPKKPMRTGKHQIECRVTFDNGTNFEKSWTMRVATAPLVELPRPTPLQMRGLEAVNRVRESLGLPIASFDDQLNMAAQAHSNYLALNHTTGHEETPGAAGFVAASGAERLDRFGWAGSSWEDVAFGAKTPEESIDDLFAAPYHRIPFLQLGSPSVGNGFADDRFTLEFSQTMDSGESVSPPDGATGVPCNWHNFEHPNPMRLWASDARITGYPIVIAHFAPGLPRLTKMFGWLTGPDGQDLPCWINTPLNDDRLNCAAILIPKQPLAPHQIYRVGFDGRDATGATIRKETSFTTGG